MRRLQVYKEGEREHDERGEGEREEEGARVSTASSQTVSVSEMPKYQRKSESSARSFTPARAAHATELKHTGMNHEGQEVSRSSDATDRDKDM